MYPTWCVAVSARFVPGPCVHSVRRRCVFFGSPDGVQTTLQLFVSVEFLALAPRRGLGSGRWEIEDSDWEWWLVRGRRGCTAGVALSPLMFLTSFADSCSERGLDENMRHREVWPLFAAKCDLIEERLAVAKLRSVACLRVSCAFLHPFL
ncbi:hypothetical protein BKA93DRAFT_368745 [Sparassis latifolia]